MKRNLISMTLLAAGVLLLGSCRIETPKDRGEVQTRTVRFGSFNKISLSCSADVKFVQGDSATIRLEGREKDLDRLDVRVEDDRLIIGIKEEQKGRGLSRFGIDVMGDLKVYVSAPDLSELTIAGAGDFECKGLLATDDLSINVAGAGDIDLGNVKARNFTVQITGAGDLDVGDVVADRVTLEISGAGDMELKERDVKETRLTVSGAGDAEIDFTGCQKAVVTVMGGADVQLSGTLQELEQSVMGVSSINTSRLKLKEGR